MSVLTIRMEEAKHERLRQLASAHGVSMNHLVDEWATIALAQHDAEVRFHARAAIGSAKRGLELLDKLEAGRSAGKSTRSAKR